MFFLITSRQIELESCVTSQIAENSIAISDLSKFFIFSIGLLEILPSKVGYTELQGCNWSEADKIWTVYRYTEYLQDNFFVLWLHHQEMDFLGYFYGSYVFSINLPLPRKLARCVRYKMINLFHLSILIASERRKRWLFINAGSIEPILSQE